MRTPIAVISRGAIHLQHCRIVVKVRVRHSQRLEDILIREGAQRLSAHPLHDDGQQRKVAVDVFEFGTGREVEFPLTREYFHNRIISVDIFARFSQNEQIVKLPSSPLKPSSVAPTR